MITIGVDAHKQVHVAVAVDVLGHEIGQWKGPNVRVVDARKKVSASKYDKSR